MAPLIKYFEREMQRLSDDDLGKRGQRWISIDYDQLQADNQRFRDLCTVIERLRNEGEIEKIMLKDAEFD